VKHREIRAGENRCAGQAGEKTNRGSRRLVASVLAGLAAAVALGLVGAPPAALAADAPVRVADLNPGMHGSDPGNFVEAGGTIYFSAYDPSAGSELWRTDGTESGTSRVADIKPGSGSSFPASLTMVGGTLYFTADDGAGGRELWRSNGTGAGTSRVADINPGGASGLEEESDLTNFGGILFFKANDGTSGEELWRSNGTAAGTTRVADINPGSAHGNPRHLTQAAGTLFFTAADNLHGNELWSTDGTASGTTRVIDVNPGTDDSYPDELTDVAGSLYFAASDGMDRQLWRTDGTSAGTVRITDDPEVGGNPDWVTDVDGTVFFVGDGGSSFGRELWSSDGTEAGTRQVADINPGVASSIAKDLVDIGGTLYLRAFDISTGFELWRSDGTSEGTRPVADINPGDASSVQAGSSEGPIVGLDGFIYFRADDGVGGDELWRSDGTSAGTERIDINPGAAGSDPYALTAIGSTLYFGARDADTGAEPWRIGSANMPADTTPPETTIISGPAEGSTIDNANPTFGFSSDELGSSFECSLDGGTYAPCTSPRTLSDLAEGSHTFSVRATDASNNTDPTPASRSFTVKGPPPPPPTDEAVTGVRIGGQSAQKLKDRLLLSTVITAKAERIMATVSGYLSVGGVSARASQQAVSSRPLRYPLTSVRQVVAAGRSVVVRQKLGIRGRKASRAAKTIKRAVRMGRKVVATIRIELRDDSGNADAIRRTIRLK
jgi:ELWxxDGT repeat protein